MIKNLFNGGLTLALVVSLGACQKQPASETAQPAVPNVTTTSSAKKTPVTEGKVYDGPFGLAGEISVAELERMNFKASDTTPGIFSGTPPRPMNGATDYHLVATPSAGLCRIRATVDVNVVNGTGDQLKAKVDELAEMMKIKYGKHSRLIDFAMQDVYRRNPQYWMLGLTEESVLYAYDWSAGKTEQPLPDGLDNIEVSANATSTSAGYAAIQYTYKNFKDCTTEMKKQRAANL